jgi:putative ABC transport system substrate-binding protein
MQFGQPNRRGFITLLGSATAAWPLAARAQQPAMPVIGMLNPQSPGLVSQFVDAFHRGLAETGYVEGQNVAIEYRWAEGRFDRFPELAADLVRHKVSVIAAPANAPALAAKAATSANGINFFPIEVIAKRLGLLRELVPAAIRVAVLANPANVAITSSTLRAVEPAARALGMQVHIYDASTIEEIDAAFATLVSEQFDALFVAPDPFFQTRRVQFAALAARHALPAAYSVRQFVEAGGLMSYGTSLVDMYRQVGLYTGRILKGEKPADLPVVQSTKFELVINVQIARMLGLAVSPSLLAIADEVIE